MADDPRRPDERDERHEEAQHETVEPGEVHEDAPPEVREAEREE